MAKGDFSGGHQRGDGRAQFVRGIREKLMPLGVSPLDSFEHFIQALSHRNKLRGR